MNTILVIEDEAQIRKMLLNCLQFEGFNALEADNGKQGLKLAQEYRPDLIVCDIMMPEMDGYDVLSELRQQVSTLAIPVIFLTAKVSMFDLRLGMDLGAEDYLTKPCNVERFLTAIKTRLKRKEELKKCYKSFTNDSNSKSFFDTIDIPKCAVVTEVFQYIDNNYQRSLNLKEVANAIGYSAAYLTDLIRQKTGKTIKQWIIERRMNAARELLSNTEESVTEIALKIGYVDPSYFIRQFKKIHDNSPNLWRKNPQSKKITTN